MGGYSDSLPPGYRDGKSLVLQKLKHSPTRLRRVGPQYHHRFFYGL